MDARRVALVLGAVVAGAALGVLLLDRDSPITVAPPLPLVVRVLNVGTHAATVSVHVTEPLGEAIARWDFPIAPGETVEQNRSDMKGSQVVTRVFVEYVDGTGSGRGDAQSFGPSSECGPGEFVLAFFQVDTSRGVSFPQVRTTCSA